ncbi:MAG TPA: hypothetical protein VF487_20455 [Chitinophagaceae bacterium]
MFNTFKGRIETQAENEIVKKGDAFLFNDSNPYTLEFIKVNISNENFTFSKEDIIFSTKQKEKYQNYLQLHPFYGAGRPFSDGVKYILHRHHEKGKTKYSIEVDNIKAELRLSWWNRQRIEWVHGRKVNWNAWQGIGAVAVVFIMLLVFFVPTLTKDVSGNKSNANPHIVLPDSSDKKEAVDSIIAADKSSVIKKTVNEVFSNITQTMGTLEYKYAYISALRYFNDYIEEEIQHINTRIEENTYVGRFAKNQSQWTEKDYQELTNTLKKRTTTRIKDIIADIENQSKGPFVFADDKFKEIKKRATSEIMNH